MMDSVSVLVGDLILRQWPYQLLHFKLSTELLPFFLQNQSSFDHNSTVVEAWTYMQYSSYPL